MVVSKEEMKEIMEEKISDLVEEKFDELTGLIDETLKESFEGKPRGVRWAIEIDRLQNKVPEVLLMKVLEAYKDVGWKVEAADLSASEKDSIIFSFFAVFSFK